MGTTGCTTQDQLAWLRHHWPIFDPEIRDLVMDMLLQVLAEQQIAERNAAEQSRPTQRRKAA
ncbi:hypothetical protein [Limnoglobus roseus]|uniref:hypothetical protein n=1 Tax=Limnoglobus roseus TaxID=2598579 RepID=UPI0011EB2F92|nr:hypothetical protein [Limnoglobus roseus]